MFNLKLRFSQLLCKYKICEFNIRSSQNLFQRLLAVNTAVHIFWNLNLTELKPTEMTNRTFINHSYDFCTIEAAAIVFFLQYFFVENIKKIFLKEKWSRRSTYLFSLQWYSKLLSLYFVYDGHLHTSKKCKSQQAALMYYILKNCT